MKAWSWFFILRDAGSSQELANLEKESFLNTHYFHLIQNCYTEPILLVYDTLLPHARKFTINSIQIYISTKQVCVFLYLSLLYILSYLNIN